MWVNVEYGSNQGLEIFRIQIEGNRGTSTSPQSPPAPSQTLRIEGEGGKCEYRIRFYTPEKAELLRRRFHSAYKLALDLRTRIVRDYALKFSNNKGNCEKKLKLWVELSKNELEIESDR